MNLREKLGKEIIILDGAMGTMLQNGALAPGGQPELLNLDSPEKIRAVHRAYIDAGAEIIYTNTFGANSQKLPADITPEKVIRAAVKIAKEAAEGSGALIALDVGPIGGLLEPLGSLTFEQAYSLFAEQMKAGAEAGADIIAIETVADLYEMKAAVLAAKENTSLPVFATMTFESGGRSFAGCPAEAAAMTLEGLGADALGINCSLAPDELLPVVEKITANTSLPVIVKANAGLPDCSGRFASGAKAFATQYKAFLRAGVSVIGGCCGTTPEFIAELKKFKKLKPVQRKNSSASAVCSGTTVLTLDSPAIVGERLNPTGKKILQQMLREGNFEYCAVQAAEQQNAGAKMLDVNCGIAGINEEEVLPALIKYLQSACPLPLQIDSANPAAIEKALRVYNGKPVLNSVNGDEETLEKLLPIAKKYGACVVGLTLDKKGLPKNCEERIAIAERIIAAARRYGIDKKNVFIDPLTLTAGAENAQALETLAALRILKNEIGVNTVLGISNVSYGLPERDKINAVFLAAALSNGLTIPIMNPNNAAVADVFYSWEALSGTDAGCEKYISRFSSTEENAPGKSDIYTVGYYVKNGLKEECALKVKALLSGLSPLEVAEKFLIPALDEVGGLYEAKRLFLPQLIAASEAAKAGFAVINEKLTETGTPRNGGTVILATVEGDVHDIGKNIVKTVMENYGYNIVDLGKNVPKEQIISAVKEHGARLVGLSALMTTTAVNMEKTVDLIRRNNLPCAVMVGGAVITEEYAKQIGADFYAADANAAVKIAKIVFQK